MKKTERQLWEAADSLLGGQLFLEEEEELAVKVIRYARNELKLKGGKLETVLRIALMETEQIHGEMAEESRVDSIAGSRFER